MSALQRSLFAHISKILIFTVIFVFTFFIPPQDTNAARMTAGKDYLNRQKGGLAQDVSHTVVFTTASAGSTGFTITFPEADDGLWCRTAGTLTTSTAVTAATDESGVTALPGNFTAACTQGAGASSYDTLTFTAVTALSAATKYGFFVSSSAGNGQLGSAAAGHHVTTLATTGGTADSINIDLDLIAEDQVAVSATVDASLTVTLEGTTVAFGTLSVDSVGSGNVTSTIRVATNASNGFITTVRDQGNGTNGGLYKSSAPTDIMGSSNSAFAATANLSALSDNQGGFGIQVTTSTCASGTINSRYNQDTGANTVGGLTLAGQTLVSTAAASGPSSCIMDVYYKAVAGIDTTAGTYADTVTYVTTGAF